MSQLEAENQVLLTALEISMRDLQANREGRMSSLQRQTIARDMALGVALLLGVLGFAILMLITSGFRWNGLLFALGLGVFIVLVGGKLYAQFEDFTCRDVRRIDGPAEKWTTHSRSQTYYHVKIHKFTFNVSRNVYENVRVTVRYTAYYAPSRPTLLALQIETDDPIRSS